MSSSKNRSDSVDVDKFTRTSGGHIVFFAEMVCTAVFHVLVLLTLELSGNVHLAQKSGIVIVRTSFLTHLLKKNYVFGVGDSCFWNSWILHY